MAEPKNIREEFIDAAESHQVRFIAIVTAIQLTSARFQVFKYVEMQTMITIVDSYNFLELYSSKQESSLGRESEGRADIYIYIYIYI